MTERESQVPEEGTQTEQPDSAEPAGEQDPANEAEGVEAAERAASESTVDSRQSAGAQDEAEEQDDQVPEEDESTRTLRERDEYLALAQRTQADFENYRKRAAKEAAAAGERARGGLVSELLPVVDNLERALGSAGEGEQHLADGVRLVHQELISVLARNGVEQFDPSGERFDPTYHEALSTRPHDGADAGVVLDVVEKGYRTGNTVLRPARVVVSG